MDGETLMAKKKAKKETGFSPKIIGDMILHGIDGKKLNIITELKDENKRSWICLLTDLKPITIFPEYLLPKIRAAYRIEEGEGIISYEVAKKALNLLEISYPEKVSF